MRHVNRKRVLSLSLVWLAACGEAHLVAGDCVDPQCVSDETETELAAALADCAQGPFRVVETTTPLRAAPDGSAAVVALPGRGAVLRFDASVPSGVGPKGRFMGVFYRSPGGMLHRGYVNANRVACEWVDSTTSCPAGPFTLRTSYELWERGSAWRQMVPRGTTLVRNPAVAPTSRTMPVLFKDAQGAQRQCEAPRSSLVCGAGTATEEDLPFLDPSFGAAGRTQDASWGFTFVLPQQGGKWVQVSNIQRFVPGLSNRTGGIQLTRYNASGQVDPSFGQAGQVQLYPTVIDIFTDHYTARDAMVLPDDRILVVGARGAFTRTSPYRHWTEVLAFRFTADGALDPTFGAGAGLTITPLPAQPNGGLSVTREATGPQAGRLVIGVSMDCRDATNGAAAVLRLLPDGEVDRSFGSGGHVLVALGGPQSECTRINRVALQSGGRIVLAGEVYLPTPDYPNVVYMDVNVRGPRHFAVARLTEAGALDPTFGPSQQGWLLTRFGTGQVDAGAYALTVLGGDKLLVAGHGQSTSWVLARLTAEGRLDAGGFGDRLQGFTLSSFGDRRRSSVLSMTLQPDGKVVAAGVVDWTGLRTESQLGLARYTSQGQLDPTFAFGGKVSVDFGPGDEEIFHSVQVAPTTGRVVVAGLMQNRAGLAQFLPQ